MRKSLKNFGVLNLVALGTSLFAAALWTALLWFKYSHFGYYDWDFALYAHALWNLAHGSIFSSLWATSFLTNHAEYIAFLLAPFYALCSHPFLLIVLKILSVTGGGFLFYLIARRILGERLALWLMGLYLIYPPNLFMLLYEFHFENLAVIFLFALFYFFERQNQRAFLICAILTALIKENMALAVATFGIFALVTPRPNRVFWAGTPLLIGGGIFIVSMFFVTPWLRLHYGITSANQYLGMYLQIPSGASWFEAMQMTLKFMATNATTPYTASYLYNLFFPLNILPFLSPGFLCLGGVLFLQHLLSADFHMKTMYYHYAASVAPFIFLATAYSLKKVKNACRPKTFRLIVLLVSLTCLFNTFSLGKNQKFIHMATGWTDHLDATRREFLNAIPPDAPVIATFEFLPELCQRKELYAFYKLWMNEERFSHEANSLLPNHVQYAIFDWDDIWLWGDSLYKRSPEEVRKIFQRLSPLFLKQNWALRAACENLTLFEKKEGGGNRLVTVSKKALGLTPAVKPVNLNIDGRLLLLGFEVGPVQPNSLTSLTFYWRSLKATDTLYGLTIQIKSQGHTIAEREHYIGYGIYPTVLWQKGDYIRETYWVLVPPQAKGDIGFSFRAFKNPFTPP